LLAVIAWAQPPAFNAALRDRIDAFVERERQASGIPGIALAIVQLGSPAHVCGFGDDGRGQAISGETPFPIGSLTKSFTALLVRQAIDAGQLDADAPVQRYLPWFRVADAEASSRITLRHLLNQTSGFSHADGVAPLVQSSKAPVETVARALATVSLNRTPSPTWVDRRCRRSTPSNWAPRRSIARRLRSLRASVHTATRWTFHTSKAWVRSSSFASVLIAVRWAEDDNQVPPISTSSGWSRPRGHAGFRYRVQPTTVASSTRRCTNGPARSWAASSSSQVT